MTLVGNSFDIGADDEEDIFDRAWEDAGLMLPIVVESAECGANQPGGGGFVLGNDCAKGGGDEPFSLARTADRSKAFKFEGAKAKQQTLFATKGEKDQMNLFGDVGVPDELVQKNKFGRSIDEGEQGRASQKWAKALPAKDRQVIADWAHHAYETIRQHQLGLDKVTEVPKQVEVKEVRSYVQRNGNWEGAEPPENGSRAGDDKWTMRNHPNIHPDTKLNVQTGQKYAGGVTSVSVSFMREPSQDDIDKVTAENTARDSARKMSEHWEKVMSTAPVYKGQAYRGVMYDDMPPEVRKKFENPKDGYVFEMNADSSATKNMEVASMHSTREASTLIAGGEEEFETGHGVVIRAKTKTAADISAATKKNEQEVIFRKGSKYKITGYTKNAGKTEHGEFDIIDVVEL